MEHLQLVKFILIPLVVGLVFLYFTKIRSQLLDSLIVLLIAGVGIALVVSPDMASGLAYLVGVGRGADLLMYISLLGIMFLLILIYSRLRELEDNIAHLVRDIAIDRAAFLTDDKTNSTPAAEPSSDSHLSDKR
jgi:hypothetical protein